MGTKRIYAPNISLTSSWTVKQEYVDRNQSYGYLAFGTRPTVASAKTSFTYALPSGAAIQSAYIWATFSSPPGGCSIRDMNGHGFDVSKGGERGVKVSLPSTHGVFDALIRFASNGILKTGISTRATLQITNLYLEITFEGGELDEDDGGNYDDSPAEYLQPPQSTCIFDQTDAAIYTFDGIIKLQHTLAMDMQEEVSGEKAVNYVNNAKNEPDKITLDVVMSDVYSGGTIIDGQPLSASQQTAFDQTTGKLIKRSIHEPWSRSENMYQAIHFLKEQRHKLSLITPQYVYTDMLLIGVTIDQDESCPFGWQGQLVFQHAFEAKKKKQQETKGGKTGDSKMDASNIACMTGAADAGKSKAGE